MKSITQSSRFYLILGLAILLVSVVISLNAAFEINVVFLEKQKAVAAQDSFDRFNIELKNWILSRKIQPTNSSKDLLTVDAKVMAAFDDVMEVAHRSEQQKLLMHDLRSHFMVLTSNKSIDSESLKSIDAILEQMSKIESSRDKEQSDSIAQSVNQLIYISVFSVIVAALLIAMALF